MANSVDLWLVMCLQITGFLYFAFMFGYVASTRSAAAHALLEHNVCTYLQYLPRNLSDAGSS